MGKDTIKNFFEEYKIEIISSIVALLVVNIIVILIVVFSNQIFQKSVGVKPDTLGNAICLKYANEKEEYNIEGITNGSFIYKNGEMICYNEEYIIDESGNEYSILNSKNKEVGKVRLSKKVLTESKIKSINLNDYNDNFIEVKDTIDELYVQGTPGNVYELSIGIAKRSNPISIIFDNVIIKACLLTPVVYSIYENVDVNIYTKGEVHLIGSNNSFTNDDIADIQKEIFNDSANAALNYFYQTIEDVYKYTGSLLFDGNDQFIKVFEGCLSNQLDAISEAWDQFDDIIIGKEGADGLDGCPAILVTGDVNIISVDNSHLILQGGNAADGDDSSFALGFSGKPNGGDGGNGGSGIVASRLIKKHTNIEIIVGEPGIGGTAHPNLKGEKGEDGVQGSVPLPYQVKKNITL